MKIIYTKPVCKPAQVSIFAIPKPFIGHVGLIQFNAIASWRKLASQVEIFLFGDEPGTREICQELDLTHVPQIERNEYGTPLLNGIFAEVCDRAQHGIIVYLNADIILTSDFLTAVQSVEEQLQDYLLIGRRWNIDLNHRLDFDSNWESDLNQLVQQDGCLADYDCKDYFVFPKHLFSEIPRFAVGRGYWDTWMVTQALADHYPVVDCSLTITAIHQNHPYIHIRGGRNEAYMGREAQINRTLGNVTQPGNIACATWQLKPVEYQYSPQLSVIIIAQDANANLEKAVLSVLIQDYDNYEIIAIDHTGNEAAKKVLQAYQPKVRYAALANRSKIDAYSYGLDLAQGEFVIYLDANSVLLPKVLRQQIACFTEKASTLDILLSGYKVIKADQVIEYQPGNDSPDWENLHLRKSNTRNNLFSESAIMFRRDRAKFWLNHYLAPNPQISENLSSLISLRGCKVSCLRKIVKNHYYI